MHVPPPTYIATLNTSEHEEKKDARGDQLIFHNNQMCETRAENRNGQRARKGPPEDADTFVEMLDSALAELRRALDKD